MNFLAHIYLSGDEELVKVGNFIGDWVKGNVHINGKYSGRLKQGIVLHRKIDTYTDSHPVFIHSSQRLKETCKRYSGVVTDVFYDHFLASNWEQYSNVTLSSFSRRMYLLLLSNYFILPGQVRQFLPFMIASNRLASYSTIQGTKRAIEIMSKYDVIPIESNKSIEVLQNHYEEFKNEFTRFFDEIIEFVYKEEGINLMKFKT